MPRRSKRFVHGVMSATETPAWYGVVEFIGLVDARASDESEINPSKKKMQKKLNDLILLMILFILCSEFTAIKIRT